METKEAYARRVAWFKEARFGMFIHWGLYALPARHEWVKSRERMTDEHYQRYFDHFNPDLYDPCEWARLARQAGMKYMVLTTKHHEGFCLWDSAHTDFKAPNTPAGRDLLKPFVEAARAEGLKVGFYYSLLDWHHPDYPPDINHPMRDDEQFVAQAKGRDVRKYAAYMRDQVRELLTRYGKIDLLWCDFSFPGRTYKDMPGKGKEDWESDKLVALIRELAPELLLNNRLEIMGDFVTPEQYQPRAGIQVEGAPVTWEACQTLNGSWGYDRDNLDWKSPDLLVRMLVDGVSKDGNLLLNVGPTARGEFEPRAVQTLEALGGWMRLHNRAIYGCGPAPFTPPPDCRYTLNAASDRLYLHIFSWPFKHLYLEGLADKVRYAQFLHDGSEVLMRATGGVLSTAPAPGDNTLILQTPIQKPNVLAPVIELFLKK
jgi:alpha-L-fucosidase